MPASPIDKVELYHVALPTRREHKWTGLTEPIGGYILVKMTDDAGVVRLGRSAGAEGLGRRVRPLFRREPGHHHDGHRALSRARGAAAALPGEHRRAARAHGPRRSRAIPTPKPPSSSQPTIWPASSSACRSTCCSAAQSRSRIPVTPFDRADADSRKPSAKPRRSRRRASARSRSRSASMPTRDVEMVRRIRETVRRRASRSASTPTKATRRRARRSRLSGAMENYHLKYFEQPVEGIERIAEVARAIDAPVMADESAWNAHDVDPDHRAARRADRVDLHHQAWRPLPRDGGRGGVPRGRHRLQRQRLDRDRHRQSRQPAPGARRRRSARSPASFRYPRRRRRSTARSAGIYYKDDLIAEPMKFVDGCDRSADRPGMGIAADRGQDPRDTRVAS